MSMRSQSTKELTTRALVLRQQLSDIEKLFALRSQGKDYPHIRELRRGLSLELSGIRALLAQRDGRSIEEGRPDERPADRDPSTEGPGTPPGITFRIPWSRDVELTRDEWEAIQAIFNERAE
jgi:hypothetical protein